MMRSQAPAAVILRTVQAVLVVGTLALLIRALAWIVVPERNPWAAVAHGAPSPALRVSAAADRFGVIAARDLFHRKVEEPVVEVAQPVVESTLEVELLGTVVADAPEGGAAIEAAPGASSAGAERRMSVALVRDVDGKVRTLAKGDVFADERAKLVEIERGRIVLEHNERLETVTLEESALAAKSGPPRRAYSAPRDPVAAAAAAQAEKVVRMQREVQRRMREAMPQVGTAEPARGRN